MPAVRRKISDKHIEVIVRQMVRRCMGKRYGLRGRKKTSSLAA